MLGVAETTTCASGERMARMVTETVEMIVKVKIRYEPGKKGARRHVLRQLPDCVRHIDVDGVAVATGVYGARVLSSRVVV